MAELCTHDTRRTLLLRSTFNGLDEVDVTDDRRALLVRFFHDAPPGCTAAHLRITGGVTVRHIRITDIRELASDDPDLPTRLVVALDRIGDLSTYTLHVAGIDGIDPRYADAPFRFFPDADDGLDCAPALPPPALSAPAPPLDYLARDYTGLRQVILDRLSVTMPGWQETHIPDIGIMLVEMLAYVGDRLSYYQDAVATEAYLATARRRISVRRHLRLIDYVLHEGCNARTLVQIDPAADGPIATASLVFTTATPSASLQFLAMKVPGDIVQLRRALTTLQVHCWGDSGCVLPAGAVSATLIDTAPQDPPALRPGDFLIFEQLVAGPDSAPDADPRAHHPVRLTAVTPGRDALCNVDLLHIAWSPEDALPSAFPLGTGPDLPTTAVRGNLLLADHGHRVTEHHTAPAARTQRGQRFTIRLQVPGLSFGEPVDAGQSAHSLMARRDPRRALPLIEVFSSWPGTQPGHPADATPWTIRPDLVGSGPDDADAVVEIDNGGVAIIRFGDGVCGRDPRGVTFEITYRAGNGTAGNTGALTLLSLTDPQLHALALGAVRNPLPATGGQGPEDLQQARLLAPFAWRDTLVRAITADDYAALAVSLDPAVQRAAAGLVAQSGRELVRIAIDPFGTDTPAASLEHRVRAALEPYRRVGHDILVVGGTYVPLILVLQVEVRRGYAQSHLRAALRTAFGTGSLPSGQKAVFNPDCLTFGTPLYGSRLVAIAQALDGVRDVTLVTLERQFDRERGVYAHGVLRMGWNEIPQLDNDPLHPDRGRLVLHLSGGLS